MAQNQAILHVPTIPRRIRSRYLDHIRIGGLNSQLQTETVLVLCVKYVSNTDSSLQYPSSSVDSVTIYLTDPKVVNSLNHTTRLPTEHPSIHHLQQDPLIHSAIS